MRGMIRIGFMVWNASRMEGKNIEKQVWRSLLALVSFADRKAKAPPVGKWNLHSSLRTISFEFASTQ